MAILLMAFACFAIAQVFPKDNNPENRIENLIKDFENLTNIEKKHDFLKYLSGDCRKDERFISLLNTRYNLFYFHHMLRGGSNFELFFNRNTEFIGKMFFGNREGIKSKGIIETANLNDWKSFTHELLTYHEKIITIDSWEKKFQTLLNGKRWLLAKAETYHNSDFPKHENKCYLKTNLFSDNNAGWDKGTEGWFYSFWLRRYKEGNFDLAKIILDWGLAYLSNVEYHEGRKAQEFKEFFLIQINTKSIKTDDSVVSSGSLPNKAASCESISKPSYPKFQSAYHKADNTFQFDPFIKIDWISKAPEKYIKIDTNNINFKDLILLRNNINMWGNAEFPYHAPLDCTTDIGYYYLLTGDGISSVELTGLEGFVIFSTSGNPSVFYGPKYYGYIFAQDNLNKHLGAGFIMLAGTKLNNSFSINTDVNFKATVKERNITYTYERAGKVFSLTKKTQHPHRILKKYSFFIDGIEYVFVQWKKDGGCDYGCCAFSYTLFKVDKTLEEVVWSRYQCDI